MESKRSTGVRRGAVLTPDELADVQRVLRQHGVAGVEILAERSRMSTATVARAAACGSCHRVGLHAIVRAARELLAEGGALAA